MKYGTFIEDPGSGVQQVLSELVLLTSPSIFTNFRSAPLTLAWLPWHINILKGWNVKKELP